MAIICIYVLFHVVVRFFSWLFDNTKRNGLINLLSLMDRWMDFRLLEISIYTLDSHLYYIYIYPVELNIS